MDEYSTSALQYGHLGKAAYLPDSRSWAFSRTLAQRMGLSFCIMHSLLTTLPSFFGLPSWNSENDYPTAFLESPFIYTRG